MKTASKAVLTGFILASSWSAQAAMCNTSDVQIDFIQVQDGVDSGTSLVTPISATSCLGAFSGNNSAFENPTMGNLGYKDDGWFNIDSYNGWWDTPGAFVEEDELQDLQGMGNIDPGWIYVGKSEGSGFQGATMNGENTSYTFIDDLITLSGCKTKGGADTGCFDNAVSGNFTWDPPATNPDALLDLLGGQFFDKVGIVFKSGNAFAMYEFDLAGIGLDPVFAGDYNYLFSGTWDMSDTLINNGGQPAGLSNLTAWARDPASTDVPLPPTAVLILFTLVLAIRRRIMA
ncbi:hypothetical protein [Salinimonas lutimaris]|uniref:hypothetical protein n=1 Tax=Salinimonas lutimaris TaxID=914153 RepID=UPI0010BFE147|nr:hypothetical protein [Salinimonas lutimaris]